MGQDEINLMSDAAHQEWLYLNAEVARLRVREPSPEEALRALGNAAECFYDGWTIRRCRVCGKPVCGGPTICATDSGNARLKEVLNSVQKFYNAYVEQLAEPYMMDIPVLQEVEELQKLLEAEAASIKKV